MFVLKDLDIALFDLTDKDVAVDKNADKTLLSFGILSPPFPQSFLGKFNIIGFVITIGFGIFYVNGGTAL